MMRESEIERQFGMKILELKPKRGVYHAITDKGDKCVKKLNYGQQKAVFVYGAKEHLINNGFPYVDKCDLALNDDPFATVNDDLYTVSSWIRGRECDFHNIDEVKVAAKTLARMHECSKGYDPPENSTLKTDIGRWPKTMEKRIKSFDKMRDMCRKKNSKTDFDMAYLSNMEYYKNLAKQAVDIINESDYFVLSAEAEESKVFCHHDFTYHNIIMGDDSNVYVVDFDYCKREIRAYDISNFMVKVLKRVDWNMEFADAILESYNEVVPLKDNEYRVIYAFLMFPQRFWRLANKYYYNKSNILQNNLVRKVNDIVEERESYTVFINEFKRKYGQE